MNFSVLDFFKFASRMPHITQILVLVLKIFWEGGGGGGSMPRGPPLEISFFFFSYQFQALYYTTRHTFILDSLFFCGVFFRAARQVNRNEAGSTRHA